MAEGHKWKPIADLPEDLEPFRDRELESLSQVWHEQNFAIEDDERIIAFNRELAREWAIETGIIEGVYTLDRGITETLIERGIDSSYIPHDATNRDPELVARIMQGHQTALEGLFAFVRGERELGTSYIKELHVALLQYVDRIVVWDQFGKPFETELEKGVYKKLPNNPRREDGAIYEYCPPEHVDSEIDRLIELHHQHNSRGVAPHIEAAWLHHAFTQIHPFQDGNGRVARALASLVFIRAGLFPLIVTRDDRAIYIELLELADSGDLAPLIRLFSQFQKQTLKKAFSHAADIRPVETLQDAVNVTRDMFVNVGKLTQQDFLAAQESAGKILESTRAYFQDAAVKLQSNIAQAKSGFAFGTATLGSPPTGDLRSLGERFHFEPNADDYFQSHLLNVTFGGTNSRIVTMLTSVGPRFQGVIAVTVYFQMEQSAIVPLSDDAFLINYRDRIGDLMQLFPKWLEAATIRGLAEWRRRLV